MPKYKLVVRLPHEYEVRNDITNNLIAVFSDIDRAKDYIDFLNVKQKAIDMFYDQLSDDIDLDFRHG